ncbi:MAG TPA: polymer-forming cytoskeletal protein [Candidatus Aquilonibacter sp.]|nr:polymer-forming cytoskeletal protein [Candidatus Aquilonibacter sp.]
MWNKQSEAPAPSTSATQWQPSQPPTTPAPTAGVRSTSSPAARNISCLGESLEIKGKISGSEDLQIDGKVDGTVTLSNRRLTVGRTGKLNSEVHARELIVYGELTGNVHASDRVEIKKDGSVTGDITTSRISVEDGAYFKGRIEIERTRQSLPAEADAIEIPVGADAN